MDEERMAARVASSQVSTHPLDRTEVGNFGLELQEDNFHRKTCRELHGILEGVRGVSEKDFSDQNRLIAECDAVIRHPEVDDVIRRFERCGCRPRYCAECIFDRMRFSGGRHE